MFFTSLSFLIFFIASTTGVVAAKNQSLSYSLLDNYIGADFLGSKFNFFSDPDPTLGFVEYVNGAKAKEKGLAKMLDGGVFLGVDNTTKLPEKGRASVRIESVKKYNKGLFIADIAHMPSGSCGVWPALWTFGPGWPNTGEIDIMEGANLDTTNTMTLHTSAGCVMSSGALAETSSLQTTDCNANNAKNGCSTKSTSRDTFGAGFNAKKGGVYAMEWTETDIKIWNFARDDIPSDVKSSNPDPSKWGFPAASFTGPGCDIEKHFQDHSIVINTTFCGEFVDPGWSASECGVKAPTCKDYVSNNPQDFQQSHWLINSIKVFQASKSGSTPDKTVPEPKIIPPLVKGILSEKISG
ncbi:Endo-1,3-beta-glucanase [Erysiphe neolycopersici]|uniref:endo-1,3(4)-beta-glucanase n=1 Tax=Erysiphe neolycopersici TaxID=212602 RepID=A0A420I7R9_9PEZI|nr:Endo-1,3-beta-glucanase [Erysiphe neolycopersici]